MNKAKYDKFIKHKIKDKNHYACASFYDCKTPFTTLLGPNGTGKSMSLAFIEDEATNEGLKVLKYSTSHDDIVRKAGFGAYDMTLIAHAFTSEGERMDTSFLDWTNRYVLKELLENTDDLVVIYDEIDSGLSFDRLYSSLSQLISICNMEKVRNPNRKIKFIFTANSYEMYDCLNTDINTFIWIPTLEPIQFKSYEEFSEAYMYYYEKVLSS